VSLLISADFLKMAPLVQEVLSYLHSHAQDVLASQANLNCLPEGLLNRLVLGILSSPGCIVNWNRSVLPAKYDSFFQFII